MPRCLTPRQWTLAQSAWAAELATDAPAGPILELCCGAGQIGLAAAQLSGRALVQIDRDPRACAWARRNAERNGIASDIRNAPLGDALRDDERFAVVIADRPTCGVRRWRCGVRRWRSTRRTPAPDRPRPRRAGAHRAVPLGGGKTHRDRCSHTAPGPGCRAGRGGARSRGDARASLRVGGVRTESDERAVVLLRRVAASTEEFLDTGAG
jgi:SAM-dependent methyltransferase